MISDVCSSNANIRFKRANLKFCGNSVLQNNSFESIDAFVADANAKAEKADRGGFISRIFNSPTAIYTGLSIPLIFQINYLIKMLIKKKAGDAETVKLIAQKALKSLKWTLLLGLGVSAGIQYLFNLNTDKNLEKLQARFDKLNTDTNAKLSKNTFNSNIIGAYYVFGSGDIIFNKKVVNEPYLKQCKQQEKLIQHELEHAHQAELIARSKDGIKKLNYASLSMDTVEELKKDEGFKKGIAKLYNDAIGDNNGKYDNKKIKLGFGTEFEAKKFIMALYILMNDEKVSYNDLPVFIDQEHYQKVIDEKGPLTPDEEKLADEYFNALVNYDSNINIFTTFNPNSSYRSNKLEQEAYIKNKK